jgi:hypothetical protein
MTEDKHEHTYPVEVQLLSNGDEPPILDFVCGICKERMQYDMYFHLKDNSTDHQFFRLRCINDHHTIVQLAPSGF